MRPMPAARCSGASAVTSTIVVQFGHETMPCGASRTSSGLTSATTSGTSGSMRNAADLSIDRSRRRPRPAAPTRARAGRRRRTPRGRGRRSSRRAAPRTRPRRRRTAADGPRSAATRSTRSSATGNARSSRMPQHLGADETGGTDEPPRARAHRRASPARTRGAARAPRARRRLLHHARDADGRRGDHLDVDVLRGERLEHLRGDAGVRLHARADERHAADAGVVVDAARARSRRPPCRRPPSCARARPSGR